MPLDPIDRLQIPANRSQNCHGRILSRADYRFQNTKSGLEAADFSAQIYKFSFQISNSPSGLEFWTPHISHFSILDSKPRKTTVRRLQNSRF